MNQSFRLIKGNNRTGYGVRNDGIFVVMYNGNQVGLWHSRFQARMSLRRAKRSKGASN